MASQRHIKQLRELLERYAVGQKGISRDLSNDGLKAVQRPLPDEVIKRKQLENEALAQDIKLKKQTLERLFGFLMIETAVVFALALFQGLRWPFNFSLDEWSFRLVVSVTITQITLMLNIAVKHLFPQRSENDTN